MYRLTCTAGICHLKIIKLAKFPSLRPLQIIDSVVAWQIFNK